MQGIFAGAGAIYLFTRSVVLLGAGRAAVFPSLVPGFTLLIGFLALGEVPSLAQLAGFAIVLLGFPADAARADAGGADRLMTYSFRAGVSCPAVSGNIDLTILNFEMSTVASMCRKMAASRNSFSTPKSSITPLPPCSSRACWATFRISSDANTLAMLQSVSASGALSSTACGGAVEQRPHRLDPGRHVGEAQRHRLVLDQDAAALHVVLHVVGGALEGAHADAEILRRLDDLARPEIDAGLAERIVLDQQMIVRHAHVLEHQLAVVHEPAAEGLVAARDRQARRCRAAPGSDDVPCSMPTLGLVLA